MRVVRRGRRRYPAVSPHLASIAGSTAAGWARVVAGHFFRPSETAVTSPLSDIAIQRELGTLPGWARRGDTLTKTFKFAAFPQGIAFVSQVADVAEGMNHHPDIDIRFTKITCTLSSHDAGGITDRDVTLARDIDRVFDGMGN